jgi:hypothetical protein
VKLFLAALADQMLVKRQWQEAAVAHCSIVDEPEWLTFEDFLLQGS